MASIHPHMHSASPRLFPIIIPHQHSRRLTVTKLEAQSKGKKKGKRNPTPQSKHTTHESDDPKVLMAQGGSHPVLTQDLLYIPFLQHSSYTQRTHKSKSRKSDTSVRSHFIHFASYRSKCTRPCEERESTIHPSIRKVSKGELNSEECQHTYKRDPGV